MSGLQVERDRMQAQPSMLITGLRKVMNETPPKRPGLMRSLRAAMACEQTKIRTSEKGEQTMQKQPSALITGLRKITTSSKSPKRPGFMQSLHAAMARDRKSNPAKKRRTSSTNRNPPAAARDEQTSVSLPAKPALMRRLREAMASEAMAERAKGEREAATKRATDAIAVDLDALFAPITPEEQVRLMNMPQHFPDGSTNREWLLSRVGVITGSRVANVAGHGFDRNFLQHMLWPSTHEVCRKFCDYGLQNEDRCEGVLRAHLDARVADPDDRLVGYTVHHCGMVSSRADRSRGYSPDGYVDEVYADGSTATVLAEYKCPYTKRFCRRPSGCEPVDVWPAVGAGPVGQRFCLYGPTNVPPPPFKGATDDGEKLSLPITSYYYDQVQWGMDIMFTDGFLRTQADNCPEMRCYFVVWTPHFAQICTVPYHREYAAWLTGRARSFMRNKYLPAMRLKQDGLLGVGEVEMVLHL